MVIIDDRIDSSDFRQALSHYASGITVVSGMVEGQPVGFTCQSFYSVSMCPPLVSFSVQRTSSSWPRIRPTGHFAVNVLDAGQSHLSSTFAKPGIDRWLGVKWSPSRFGNPVISGVLCQIDCHIQTEHEAGDHLIVVGHVRSLSRFDTGAATKPLIYYRGQYRGLSEEQI